MPDMTNEQIAERLRDGIAWRGNERWEDVQQRILAIAEELQPKPEFEPGDWVWARDARRVYRYTGRNGKWLHLDNIDGTQRDCLADEIEPLGCDLLNLGRQYHDGKLISTDGLPDGEYRIAELGQFGGSPAGWTIAEATEGCFWGIIRRKEAPNG